MATMRSTNTNQEPTKTSLYEQSREARIKENMERMKQLGLNDLSIHLKSLASPPPPPPPPPRRLPKNPSSTHHKPTPFPPPGPVRRSSRLQNATPVSYSEVVLTKKGKCLEDEDVLLEEGSKPEVYTEEHEKLLGNTERSWTLFVDGYGNNGKRIYDSFKGKTCHQCRQKTLGYRTACSKCNMVQGQFCGDCLYMRYGEHVLEAMETPNWICPVCRGICNCSLCRQAKGWPATGSLYRQISKMGFKSVAHYLVQTRRAKTNSEENLDTTNQVSAKRSLSFPDTEAPSKESPQFDDNQLGSSKFEEKGDDDYKSEKENKIQTSPNAVTDSQFSAKRSLLFSNIEAQSDNMESAEIDLKVHAHLGLSKPQLEDKRDDEFKCEKEKESYVISEDFIDSNVESANVNLEFHAHLGLSNPQLEAKRDNEFECEKEKELHSNMECAKVDREVHAHVALSKTQDEDKGDDEFKCEEEKESHVMDKEHIGSNINMESAKVDLEVHDQLGLSKPQYEDRKDKEFQGEEDKELNCTDNEQINSTIALVSCQKLQKKRALAIEPSLESVAGRLRQRRRTGNGHDDELTGVNEKNLDVKEPVNDIMSEKEVEKEMEMISTDDKYGDINDIVSEKEVEKEKEMISMDNKHGDSNIVLERSPKPKKKPGLSPEPNPDSVARRLKQRRDNIARRLRPRSKTT